MVKVWALILAFFLVCQVPAESVQERVFFAVFANPRWEHEFDRFHPDLVVAAYDWDHLNYFIQRVRDLAGDRPVVIDIAVHGEPDGGLYIEDAFNDDIHESNPGYVLNELEKLPNLKKVYLEACYAGIVMESGLYKSFKHMIPGDRIEPWDRHKINFELYGVHRCSNYVGLVFLQDHYDIKVEFHDLTKYINHKIEKPDHSSKSDLWTLFCLLSTFKP